MTGFVLETPKCHENLKVDEWFCQHAFFIKIPQISLQRETGILPCLTFRAGPRAVQAVKDYNVYELALAITGHYHWQLINGAKILPDNGEIAKVYAGTFAMYLFKTKLDMDAARKRLKAKA